MEWIVSLDQTTIFWVQNHLVTGLLSPVMIGLSELGNFGAVWILTGIVMLSTKKYRRAGVGVFIALLFSLIIGNGILKHAVMRVRPCIDYPWMPMLVHIPNVDNFSFPSGHTFGSFAAATAMFSAMKRYWGIAALSLAAAIGFSRIYLFLHYPSDVFAGSILGIIAGAAAWCLSGKLILWMKNTTVIK